MQTIQQQRAKFALKRVLDAKKAFENLNTEDSKEQEADKKAKANNAKEEFKSYASALPAMIHMNGLGQAAAFYKSKAKNKPEDKDKFNEKGKDKKHNPYEMLYQLLSDWLTQDKQAYAEKNYEGDKKDLIKAIVNHDMHQYRLAQAEAQALMDWVKKFAKAYMVED